MSSQGLWVGVRGLGLKDVARKFGDATAQLLADAQARSIETPLFALDRKVFRRIVKDRLPPRHGVMDAREQRTLERGITAARAFARLEAGFEPRLTAPPELAHGRCLLWSSWALRPREIGKIELEFVVVEFEELEHAMWALWSRVYLESRLSRIPDRATKLDVSLGVAPYGEQLEECLRRLSGRSLEVPFQVPSFAVQTEPLFCFEQELYQRLIRGFTTSLGALELPEAPTEFVVCDAGRLGLRTQVSQEKGPRAFSNNAALGLVFGAAAEPNRKPHGLFEKLTLGVDLLLWARRTAQLELETERLRVRVEVSEAWMQELDLAVLPDDGLRRTLEELASLWDEVTRLGARAELVAAIHVADYQALTGLPLSVIDAGLPLPLGRALEDFEEAMSRVRGDPLARHARSETGHFELERLAEGPARRALSAFATAHGWLLGERGLWHPDLLEAVARGLETEASVRAQLSDSLTRADRMVALFEQNVSRVLASSLAPFRLQTRAAVLLRERTRSYEIVICELFRRTLIDIDRRLPRLEPGLEPGSAYHAYFEELVRILDLRGENLVQRVRSRKREVELSKLDLGGPHFTGLAERRSLPLALALPYSGPNLGYRGRSTDSLPTLARALGIDLAWA